MESVLLYILNTPALFYLGSRAVITRFLWSRYPPKLAAFMDCAACAGFWYGFLSDFVLGNLYGLSFLGVSMSSMLRPILVGLCSITWTPIGAGLVQWGFDNLGSIHGPQD